ncbi:substrate import-associated zinc metallohydrolase lipoprotein [Chitinophaga skermanii]|uniref:Substrate import-associated zinc metallohydrolase lipoprotein n=1 Tax=Chitinophaga skermanii TaxID=331697 RepID=A0A327QW34_9BACT|nr:putative zinc-binding metallopeptidase [Chitinophaga skermanii]RAJ08580.1 substrate import-associated zinc metallohydrolase lipoprotein [Chitinophaga skermanii]
MKKYIVAILSVCFAASVFTACSKNDDNLDIPLMYEGDKYAKNAIDTFIINEYIIPYNISVKFRWDPFEVPTNKFLVPVKEDVVIPVMTIVKQIWINPYEQMLGKGFIQKYAPKQYVLVGSANYNNDGTIVLGEAEGGRKITLYQLNKFDRKNVPFVKQMLHTIHHEFAHILHQTILYQREYKQITPGGYTATWYNTSNAQALALGFITPYARSNSDEDFVEMISTMLVEGKAGFDAIVNAQTPAARDLLRRKEALVSAYMLDKWKVDIYELQTITQAAIAQATN